MKNNKLILAGILIFAALLRLWQNTKIALWHDEAFSALLIRMPYDEMMHRIGLDVHPPLYYWLLRGWDTLFGDSLFSLRAFSVLFGVATVWMLYIFVKDLTKNAKIGLGAALLLAVNAFHMRYSFEARMYTLGTFLVVLSSWFILKAINKNQWRWWLLYGASVAAMALTHYFLLFSIAAQGFFILIWFFKSKIKSYRWLGAYALSFFLYAFWLPVFVEQFTRVQDNYWIPKLAGWSIPDVLWKMIIRGFDGTHTWQFVAGPVIFFTIGTWFLIKRRSLNDRMLMVLVVAPFILAVLASIKSSIFLDRYLIFASIFFVGIIAILLLSLKNRKVGIGLLIAYTLLSTGAYVQGMSELDIKNRPGMAAASQYIFDKFPFNCNRQNREPSHIIVGKTAIYFNYLYYYDQYLRPNRGASFACELHFAPEAKLHLPGINSVSQIPHFSGAALLEDHELLGNFIGYAKSGEAVYMLWTTGFYGSKPEVPSNWQQIEEQKFPDVYQYRGEIFVTKYLVK